MKKYWSYFLFLTLGLIGLLLFFLNSSMGFTRNMTRQTLSISPTREPTLMPGVSPSVTPVKVQLSKQEYTIALYGDSMIDTMSDVSELLLTSLENKYPGVLFTVYNYGIGAQNVSDGLGRFDSSFSNRGREYPSIGSVKPDLIVVGSFAYNPFSPHDRDRHKALLAQVVQKAKQVAPTYMLAEIAPLGADFGKGTKGVNWPEAQAVEHSDRIIEQIENVFIIGQSENVPVIDVFLKSRIAGATYGQRAYVNVDDGIHPSYMGHRLMAETIVDAIILK